MTKTQKDTEIQNDTKTQKDTKTTKTHICKETLRLTHKDKDSQAERVKNTYPAKKCCKGFAVSFKIS